MAGGNIEFTQSATSGSYIDGKIQWVATAVAANNNSEFKADFYVKKGNTTMELTVPTDGTWTSGLSINGGSYTTRTLEKSVLEDFVYIGRITTFISHNGDGTKTVDVSGYISAPAGTSYAGHTTRGSARITLDAIPRPTTIDSLKCSTSYLDGTITALYTPKYSGFYNQCYVYVIKDGDLTLIRSAKLGTKSASQQTSTIKFSGDELETIYNIVGDTTKATIRVVFKTFVNSDYTSQSGSNQYLDITLSIPQSVIPTVNLAITPKNSNAWIASKNIYVAGLSGATVTLSGAPSTGAEITSRNIIYNNATYEAASLTINTLKNSGNTEFIGKIVDSRGRSATTPKSINVLPYSQPAVTSIIIERGIYSTKWTADEDGADLRVIFRTTLALVNEGNKYKAAFELDGTAITAVSGTISGLSSATDYTVYFQGIDSEVSHTLKLIATDSVGKSGAAIITVPTAHITIEYNVSGKGIAFGKTSEKDAFECAFPAEFSSGVKIIRDDGTEVAIGDTGWINLGLSANVAERSTAAGHAGRGCKYRVVNGNHVYVAFCCEFTYSNSAVTVNLDSIPSAYRPANHIYAMCATGGRAITRCIVNSSGNILVDWVQVISSAEQTTSSTVSWVDGYIDYFI